MWQNKEFEYNQKHVYINLAITTRIMGLIANYNKVRNPSPTTQHLLHNLKTSKRRIWGEGLFWTYSYRWIYSLDIGLLHKDFSGLGTECFNLRLLNDLTTAQLFNLTIQITHFHKVCYRNTKITGLTSQTFKMTQKVLLTAMLMTWVLLAAAKCESSELRSVTR